MFDLVINEDISDRQLLVRLIHGVHAMALKFEGLEAAVTRSTAASEALIALAKTLKPDPAVEAAAQATIDTIAEGLNAQSANVEALLPPPDPVKGPE